MLNKLSFNKKTFTKLTKISYSHLKKAVQTPNTSLDFIESGYGYDGLGAIVIENVDGHFENKQRLLKMTSELVALGKDKLKTLERPDLNYGLGWSHGVEKFNGKPDFFKGSYYAKAHVYDEISRDLNYDEVFFKSMKQQLKTKDINHWPIEMPLMEPAYHSLINQIREIGLLLVTLIDRYIKKLIPAYNVNMNQVIRESNNNTGRLLHYFPRGDVKLNSDDQWCGWHNDHGALTGLCSAMFFNQQGDFVNDKLKLEKSGLWIQARNGNFNKVSFGKNDIAFQIGECYQILSGGKLHATPHAVIIDNDVPSDVHRSTLALFMEPKFDYKLCIPTGTTKKDVYTSDIYPVPKIQDRFVVDGMTFGEFNDLTMGAFNNVK